MNYIDRLKDSVKASPETYAVVFVLGLLLGLIF